MGAADLEDPLDFDHITDSRGLELAGPTAGRPAARPLTVGWICTPPAPVRAATPPCSGWSRASRRPGHSCVLYLYDRFGGELPRHERVIRAALAGHAGARSARSPTAWRRSTPTSPPAGRPRTCWRRRRTCPPGGCTSSRTSSRLFYPLGSDYHVLAEDTYRFGFRSITVGPMLGTLLRDDYGVSAAVAEFGCDTRGVPADQPRTPRRAWSSTRSPTARRGFVLGMLALREFHRRHPTTPIHLFGDAGARVPNVAGRHPRPDGGPTAAYRRAAHRATRTPPRSPDWPRPATRCSTTGSPTVPALSRPARSRSWTFLSASWTSNCCPPSPTRTGSSHTEDMRTIRRGLSRIKGFVTRRMQRLRAELEPTGTAPWCAPTATMGSGRGRWRQQVPILHGADRRTRLRPPPGHREQRPVPPVPGLRQPHAGL